MEWKILEGKALDVQRTLNTWRHTYHITIHGYHVGDFTTSVLLTREKKEV